MSKSLKWGVIGSGGIARRRTIPEGLMKAPSADLVAVYDINSEVNKEVADEFNAATYDSVEALLSSDVDAVYIASPVNAHLDQVIKAAEAKKHILCEKPLGLNVAEAEKMLEVCEKNEVVLGIGYMMRFLAQHEEMKQMVDKGMIGKPVFGRAQLSCWYPDMEGAWRQDPALGGGGSLMDMGSHCIDLLEMFFGKVKRLSCFVENSVHAYKSEDSAIVSLAFENGTMATVDAFFCIPDNSSKNVLELYGSGGSILAQGTIGQGEAGTVTAFLEDSQGTYDAQQARQAGGGIDISPAPVNMYMAEIEDFSNAILNGRIPYNNSVHALRSQKIMHACYESATRGIIVQMAD